MKIFTKSIYSTIVLLLLSVSLQGQRDILVYNETVQGEEYVHLNVTEITFDLSSIEWNPWSKATLFFACSTGDLEDPEEYVICRENTTGEDLAISLPTNCGFNPRSRTIDVTDYMRKNEDFELALWPTFQVGPECTGGLVYKYRVTLRIEEKPLPNCVRPNLPFDGQSNYSRNFVNWAGSGNTRGNYYHLTIGTAPGIGDIYNHIRTERNRFSLPNPLPCNKTLYMSVIAFDQFDRETEECFEISFTTLGSTIFTGDDIELCSGDTARLISSGASNYQWSPTIGIDSPNIAKPKVFPDTTTTYTLYSENALGCLDTSFIKVTINVTAAQLSPNQIICGSANTEEIKEVKAGKGQGSRTYQWQSTTIDCDKGYSNITGATNKNYNPSNLTQTTYFRRVDKLVKTDSTICYAKSKCVTISVLPSISTNASSMDETGLGFNDGTATCNPMGLASPFTYLWSNGKTTQSISDLAPGDYSIVVTDTNSCTNNQSITIEKFVCPSLTLNNKTVNASCFDECDGSIEITNIDNAVMPISYTWKDGKSTQQIDALCAGEYELTIKDAKHCESVEQYTISSPDEIIITSIAVETIKTNKPGKFTLDINNSANYAFSWTGPANYSSKDQSPSDIVTPGCYRVVITENNTQCTTDSTVCIDMHTGTNQNIRQSPMVSIYPNPVHHELNIDFGQSIDRKAIISIYDNTGKRSLLQVKHNNNKVQSINVSSHKPGLYFISVENEEGNFFKKIIFN